MATFYWVGGSGNWDATSTTNWASSSGGAGGAGAPTSNDDVIFDALSNTGTDPFTVTITGNSAAPAVCNDFTAAGLDGAMTLASTSTFLDIYGSMTLPATNFSVTGTSGNFRFRSASTGKTITTNGVTFPAFNFTFNGNGGEWTLGSAFTATGSIFSVVEGTFNTGNFNITVGQLNTSGTSAKTINLGSSTITLTGTGALVLSATGLTWDAGTSQITCSGASPAFTGGGQTFYNVSFTSAAAGTVTINGSNTFNNLTFTSRNANGVRQIVLGDNQTINGTLTLGAANTAVRRITIQSTIIGAQRTITLNGTLATLSDVDFRDTNSAGTVATPWIGTRIGDGLGNSNITFDAPKTVYWNLAGTQNWSATGWATTNNGTPAVNNFPLAQDTATFTEAGAAGTVTTDANWFIGDIQMADGVSNRTTAFTLGTGSATITIHKNITLFSNLTLTGTGSLIFCGQGTTQTITSAGRTFTQQTAVNAQSGTVQLLDNLTLGSTRTFTLTNGALDLNNLTLSTGLFNSTNSNVRSIAFGTGNIELTGNAATVWDSATATNFSYTGTPTVNATYAGSTGSRIIHAHRTAGGSETNALDFNITAGTDLVAFGSVARIKSLDLTGFSGTLQNNGAVIFRDLTLSIGCTVQSLNTAFHFSATSGTQEVITNGKLLNNIAITAQGAVVQFQDALTQNSGRTFTLISGTVQLKDGVTSTVGVFATSGVAQKFLESTLAGSQATLSQASGTVNVSNLTIKDINATGGATFNAFTTNNNVDAGNNTGWDFFTQLGKYIYTRRKNKRILLN